MTILFVLGWMLGVSLWNVYKTASATAPKGTMAAQVHWRCRGFGTESDGPGQPDTSPDRVMKQFRAG